MWSKFVVFWRACNLTSFTPCLTGPVDYPFASHHEGTRVQIPRGLLMWNRDSPVSVVLLHWCPHCDPITGFVAIQWVLHKASCLQCVSQRLRRPSVGASHSLKGLFPASQRRSRLLGGALWRACNVTSFTPCLTGPVDYPFAYCHKGPGFKSPGGYLCETWILLLALSCYSLVKLKEKNICFSRKCM